MVSLKTWSLYNLISSISTWDWKSRRREKSSVKQSRPLFLREPSLILARALQLGIGSVLARAVEVLAVEGASALSMEVTKALLWIVSRRKIVQRR